MRQFDLVHNVLGRPSEAGHYQGPAIEDAVVLRLDKHLVIKGDREDLDVHATRAAQQHERGSHQGRVSLGFLGLEDKHRKGDNASDMGYGRGDSLI